MDYQRLFFFLTDSQIIDYYFGDFSIGKKYSSPFRKDPNPSLVFTYHNDKLYWRDFGLGRQENNDSIGFVEYLYGIDRQEAIDLIFNDLVIDRKAPKRRKKQVRSIFPNEVKWAELEDWELEYWKQLHLYRDDLDRFNVKACRGLLNKGKLIAKSIEGDPMYVYLTGERDVWKTYRPLTKYKVDKFRGQGNGNVIQGWEALPYTGDVCLINSSLKDTMVNTKAGFPGCNANSETAFNVFLPKIRELNARFKKNIIFLNNDEPGILASRKMKQITGWDAIQLPFNFPKDPSDLVMKTGNYYELKRFLNNSI